MIWLDKYNRFFGEKKKITKLFQLSSEKSSGPAQTDKAD